jgi:hypothetical protein
MTKPKSKTQKKTDNNIRLVLTDVCEHMLQDTPGFQWLTHDADYSDFPASLLVTCVFDTEESRQRASESGHTSSAQKLIQSSLLKIGIKLKSLQQQIIFKSEEALA